MDRAAALFGAASAAASAVTLALIAGVCWLVRAAARRITRARAAARHPGDDLAICRAIYALPAARHNAMEP